ncbi:MAG: DNA polymerase III subunit delta [Mogibacterium sp.]|nr:DNA polymerase III subunit delta [Mogibacterium sp.]
MSYKDFVNDFRKGITRDVLFFYGAEDYLMEWSLDQIIAKYVDEEWRSLDVKYLDGNTVNAYEIMGEARAFSMFSEKRVVIVRNYLPLYKKAGDPGSEELLDFAGEKQGTSVLVFVLESRYSDDLTSYGKKLAKAASGYEFARLEKADLRSFINKRIHNGGKIISRRDLDFLIDASGYYNKESGYDLTRLDADLAKIVKACEDDTVDALIIEDLLIGDNDRFAFNLVDAVVSGNRSKALEIAETIIREEDGAIAVTALLIKQFEIMYDALELEREGYSIAQMAKKTGVNEYRFKRAYQAAGAYSLSRLKELLIHLYNIERDMKRGDIDKDVALELFSITAASRR